jgi:hypothetical protein
MVNASIWKMIDAPWLNEPELIGKFADAMY